MITDPDWKGVGANSEGKVHIGTNTVIKPNVVINRPATHNTYIGDSCYIMPGCFIGHDAYIGDNVTMCPNACAAGFCTVGEGTTLGMNSSVHQHSKLGRFCMVGANSFFKGESPDGITWVGVPARPLKVNTVGINRSNIDDREKRLIMKNAELFVNRFKVSSHV